MVRSFLLLSGAMLMLGVSVAAWAASPCPRSCPTPCVPNVGDFGYFRTMWRQWPGTPPLEQVNPQAVDREVIPTPLGVESVPVPMAVPLEGEKAPPQAGKPVPPTQPAAPEPPPMTIPARHARAAGEAADRRRTAGTAGTARRIGANPASGGATDRDAQSPRAGQGHAHVADAMARSGGTNDEGGRAR